MTRATDVVTIGLADSDKVDVLVYNINGQLVETYQDVQNGRQLHLRPTGGVWLLKVVNGQMAQIIKVAGR